MNEPLELISMAAAGDESAIKEINLALQFRHAIKQIFEDNSPRLALLIIGKYYADLSEQALGEIFKIRQQRVHQIFKEFSDEKNI